MKGFYKALHRVFAAPLRWLFNVKIVGTENEPCPGQPVLVCSNHISAWDPVWLCAVLKRRKPHIMAKAELFKIPVLNCIIRFFGAYPVERGGADVSSLRHTVELLKQGNCVGMFPQGTRCSGKDPAATSVKSGAGMIAVRSCADVLPIHIYAKNYKHTPFGRKTIVIGKPIPSKVIIGMHEAKMTYHDISQYIFDKVCELKNDVPKNEKGNSSNE